VDNLDWIAVAICLALALPKPGLGEPIFGWVEQRFARFAKNKTAAIGAIGAAAILLRLALLPWMPVPQPKVHDEFSYLLAADTFAHGRLANPPHPMWAFFDTFHVIHHPTYSSMYPPAQGMVLAVGQLLGNPWIGVLLSVAAMCMAIVWMLQGWVPAEWALLGGVLVVSQAGIFSYWMNSYWGGAVAATAAAMVLGAMARIWEYERPRDAILCGTGVGILAISRPFEGFIFCIPLGVALLWWVLRQDSSIRRARLQRVLLPLAAIVACAIGFVAYYNWKVTGSPLVFPHFIEGRLITTALFIWQHDKPPIAYANPQFDDFYHNFLPGLYKASWPEAVGQLEWKATAFWQFFLGPALSIPLLALPWLLKERRNWLLLIQVALSALGLWIVVYFNPHYAAPLMATVVVLAMQGMRKLRRLRFLGRAVGAGLTRLIVLFNLSIGPVYFVHMLASKSNAKFDRFHEYELLILGITVFALIGFRIGPMLMAQFRSHHSWLLASCEFLLLAGILIQICISQGNSNPDDYPFVDDLNEPFRRPVEQKLAALPGEHLVLVRYSIGHNSGEEYVYNKADIDRAKTVWAREIPGLDIHPLLNYFRNRDVWIFEPDVDNSVVRRYE